MSYVKLFVGNLPWSIGDVELERLFSTYGEVQSARVITDRDTGRSRGFGFVELDTDDVTAAINAVNGREVDGRPLRVNEAEDKNRGGGGGGGGFGGGRRDDRGPRNRY
jgi:RNA recognition motif-containing protein